MIRYDIANGRMVRYHTADGNIFPSNENPPVFIVDTFLKLFMEHERYCFGAMQSDLPVAMEKDALERWEKSRDNLDTITAFVLSFIPPGKFDGD